jgi:hypothetical protein
MRVCVHVCEFVCVNVCLCVYLCVCLRVYVCMRVQTSLMCLFVHVSVRIGLYVRLGCV